MHYVTIRVNVYESADSLFPVIIEPDVWIFTPRDAPAVDLIQFEIKNVSDQEFGMYPYEYNEEILTLDLPLFIDANSSVFGSIRINQNYIGSRFTESATIKFTDSADTRFTIPIINYPETP